MGISSAHLPGVTPKVYQLELGALSKGAVTKISIMLALGYYLDVDVSNPAVKYSYVWSTPMRSAISHGRESDAGKVRSCFFQANSGPTCFLSVHPSQVGDGYGHET
jgi:hypothetical protein